MKVVHKAQLFGAPGYYRIHVPIDFEFLHLGNQNEMPTIWYLCGIESKPEISLRVVICGTGEPLVAIEDKKYWGTVICHGGSLVWHVWGEGAK